MESTIFDIITLINTDEGFGFIVHGIGGYFWQYGGV
jgi:hypothetical protein